MNPNNYASLEASQRLVEAGVMLETDAVWSLYLDGFHLIMQTDLHLLVENIPAPSMAEVWRELPECIPYDDTTWAAWQAHKQGDLTIISIAAFRKEFISLNPTDALIDLLILVKKEASHEST